MSVRLLLVGCGKMGGALLEGWAKYPDLTISILDPHDQDANYSAASDIPSSAIFDVIVLAVKPQIMTDAIASLKHLIKPNTLILSIAAGKTLHYFESLCGATHPIIRVMPNTPALINKGMSVLCGNAFISDPHKQLALGLMSCVGLTEWIDDENLMNSVTALSGSGPAYLFHLIEAMTSAGMAAGLPDHLATTLARQTVIGAAALADHDATHTATTLRENVTSPGGTTAAALNILMDEADGLTALMTKAISAAKKRGEELAS